MPNTLLEFRLRIRSADNLSDALEVTSVRGGTNPYISGEPSGDGAIYDPITGVVTSGSYSVRVVDPITSGTSRLFTSVMEDANFQQQLGHRRAFLEFREDAGVWQTLYAGRLTQYRLVSDIEWEVVVGDYMQAEHEYSAFDQKPDATQADGLEAFATYLARWPNRGCLLGGPIRNGFLHVADLGGWQFKVGEQGGVTGYNWTRFDYVAGYDTAGQPLPGKGQRLEDVRNAINAVAEGFWQPSWESAPVGEFPELRILVDGAAYQPASRYVGDPIAIRRPRELLSKTLLSPLSFWLPGTVGTVGNLVRVHVISRTPTDASPIYWTGHPVDLLTALWTEAGLPYSASAAATAKDAIGRGARLSLRITEPKQMGSLLEQAVYGPWGVGARSNSAGEIEAFSGRILISNTLPSVTITEADVDQDATDAFDLDTADAIRKVIVEHVRLVQPVLFNVLGQPYRDPDATTALVAQAERIERGNGDPGAIGTGEVTYTIPGMVHFSIAATVHERMNVRSWTDGRAAEIFDRYGRGPIRVRTRILRTSAAATVKLGQEILVDLPQLPHRNKRLIDDATVVARAMQVVQLTPQLRGIEVELVDSGPNAAPLGTVPTLTIAKFTGGPRHIAEVTVTNAATLNTNSIACRIQVAVTSGAAPTAEDYTDVLFFRVGQVPTVATKLPPASANSTVYVRARGEKRASRPSAWSTVAGVALDALNAPTSLTATPSGSDGSKADLVWTNGASSGTPLTEVWLRLSTEAFAAAVLKDVLPAGSTFYRLEGLTPGTSYIASVRHLDDITSGYSALTEVTFTAGATTVTLTAPAHADGFSLPFGSPTRRVFGNRTGPAGARYGIAVVAREFPSDVEVEEAVETGVGTGVYGAYAGAARVGSVTGDWTIWSRITVNDRLRRKLRARHVRDGSTASGYTAEVVVDPATYDAVAVFPLETMFNVTTGRVKRTAAFDDGYYAAQADDGAGQGLRNVVGVSEGGSIHKLYRHREEITVAGPDTDGDVAITFAQTYQNVPMILFRGGQYVSFSNILGTAVKQRLRIQPLNATASGFTSRTQITSVGSTTAQTDDFASGNVVNSVGGTAEVNLDPAGANDDTYTVNYRVSVTVDLATGASRTATLVLAIDTNDGTGWVERATFNYSASAPSGDTNTITWNSESKPIVVSGLGLNDDIRIRAKSFTVTNSGTGSFEARGADGAGTNPDTRNGVTYTTAADTTESAIPAAGDTVTWVAQEVV